MKCIIGLAVVVVLWGSPCLAGEVRIGIGYAIPPYVIQELDSGLEVEVIREALDAVGYEAQFVYLPNLRLPLEFSQGTVDGVATNAAYDLAGDSGWTAYPSSETVVFQNYAISLQGAGAEVASVAELADKRVLAFNNASKYLGAEFAAMARSNAFYWELADQSLQVRMLYSQRADVVVSDKRIFHYWRQKMIRSNDGVVDYLQPLRFDPIFPPAVRHVAFRSKELRDRFDEGLATIRGNGVFDFLLAKYAAYSDQ